MLEKIYFVYMMVNEKNSVIYIGVTNNLTRRYHEHSAKISYHQSFTKKYNLTKLVWYESYKDVRDAIAREKQLKGGSRQKKIDLINQVNGRWNDLGKELLQ